MSKRCYARIDLNALLNNVNAMKNHLQEGTQIAAVIKTDGYGHGAVPIAQKLDEVEYIWGFAVATIEEAMELKEAGINKPILIIGFVFEDDYELMVEHDIRTAVFTLDMAEKLSMTAIRLNKEYPVHIKVDTGMARIGCMADEEGVQLVSKINKLPMIKIEGIFTHFAKADEADKTPAKKQLALFHSFVERVEKEAEITIPMKHCSNSASIIEIREANMDMVRAGIILYGLWPSDEVDKNTISLSPVMSLYSSVSYIKTVPEGTEVSYNGTYVTKRFTKIATVPVGYGDGYPRTLSNKGYVLIHGMKAPIIGRICMDQFMVDITDIPNVAIGDVVTLIGTDGNETITIEMLGSMCDRFNYEFVCDLNKRVPRIYFE